MCVVSVMRLVRGEILWVAGAEPERLVRAESCRQHAMARGVWCYVPVDLCLYPGSDLHDELLGPLDDRAWSRAIEASPK